MDTTAAAATAQVTTATIRTWCRVGAVAAVKVSGRWIIDAASLTARIAIGAMKTRTPAHSPEFAEAVDTEVAQAIYMESIPSLRSLLAYVEARDAAAFIGRSSARIPESQWTDADAYLRREIANLTTERRTSRAIYDYS